MAVKHAGRGEGDFVSNDRPVSCAVSQSAAIAIRGVDKVEVLRHAAIAYRILHRWPREPAAAGTDDECLFVMFVKGMLRGDVCAVLKNDIHNRAVL